MPSSKERKLPLTPKEATIERTVRRMSSNSAGQRKFTDRLQVIWTPPNYPRSYRNTTIQRLECTQNCSFLIILTETDVRSWTTTTNTLGATNLRAICAMRTSRIIRAATQSLHPIKSSIWDGGIQISTPMLQLVEHNRSRLC